ncbi:MAG TPA: hypothetical protein VKR61_06145 [Bryobacteraceae bacterium]|nr:hypothetical protein [Bryobacteraceae bacterium]
MDRGNRILWGLAALLAAVLAVYSQTRAFAWDEGFHLLTAQLIDRGRRPYLDFCFSQTPLNAYWNAGWMLVFGDTWRTAHGVAAVMTTLAVLLTAGYLLRSFPEEKWRTAAAVSAVFLVGLNIVVVEFGTIGQAYALCLFLIVGAFRLTVAAVDRAGAGLAAGAGFLACAAANSSLLTAPVAPVLLLWMLWANRAGRAWVKLMAFAAGGAVACAPLAWLFAHGPRQTIFNVLEYNMRYRQRHWEGAVEHNIDQWSAWLDSPQALMLGLLAAAGVLFVWKQSGWDGARRREFYLCGWLAVALMAHISTAVPTFTRYYLLAAPFLTILSCAGLYAVGARLAAPDRPRWPVLIVCLISGLCLARAVYEGRDDYAWHDEEEVAAKVKEVTPPRGVLLADEPTYFVTRHAPPSGMELADSHKLDFPPAVAAELHVVPQAELDRRIKARVYDTVEMDDDDQVSRLGLAALYPHSAVVGSAHIFWR